MLGKNHNVHQRRWGRILFSAALAISAAFRTVRANATITQGDFSIFGNLETRWSGRWGEGSSTAIPCAGTACLSPAASYNPGHYTGGSYDFSHWDLVQARSLADLRLDYHTIKNYNLFGRFDTLFIKDANLFAVYRPWYDAFADLKHRGVSRPGEDWSNYDGTAKNQQFVRNDLREYYSQLTFTDNFSARIGKQQVIWSEADALSGSDITNPNDLRFHWTHFESPEDLRKNLRMIKLNYTLPDLWKTANDEIDGFVIPGDWEAGATQVNEYDERSPYVIEAPFNGMTYDNIRGLPINVRNLHDYMNLRTAAIGPTTILDVNGKPFAPNNAEKRLSNTLDNSEFGSRVSSFLAIGNGLQASIIYLYEARNAKTVWNAQAGCTTFAVYAQPGICASAPIWPAPPGITQAGTVDLHTNTYWVRSHFFGLTGTYYDKDLTDVVYRYDFSWQNKTGVFQDFAKSGLGFPINPPTGLHSPGGKWTQQTRWIVAADRPTYIRWISKQHTFFTAQYVMTWYPDLPTNAVRYPGDTGKIRSMSNFAFLNAVNWLINGQLVTSNGPAWDIDDNAGEVTSTNTYRYSRNIIFGLNGIWYLGRSGRATDPYFFSNMQRANEVEFKFTYEI